MKDMEVSIGYHYKWLDMTSSIDDNLKGFLMQSERGIDRTAIAKTPLVT